MGSVLLPVFNGAKYLEKAIDSILEQSFKDFELLVINDGSTDNSLDLINSYTSQDSRVRLVDRENRGLIATLNEGVQIAKGKYLARMDADDISAPNRFEVQLQFLENHTEYVAVGSRVLFIDEDGDPLMLSNPEYDHEKIDAAHLCAKSEGSQLCHPSVMMKLSVVKSLGGYDKQYTDAEDIDLFLRMAEVGKLANLKQPLLSYRQHFSQICFENKTNQLDNVEKAIRKACQRRAIALPCGVNRLNELVSKEITPSKEYRKWGWWALKSGYKKSARKNSLKAIRLDPFNIENLRLLVCALRGH